MFIFPYSPSMRSYLFGNFEPHLSFDVLNDDEIIDVLTDVNAALKNGASNASLMGNQKQLKETAPGPQKHPQDQDQPSKSTKKHTNPNAVVPKKVPDQSVDEISKDNIGDDPLMESYEKIPEKTDQRRSRGNHTNSKASISNEGVDPVDLPPAPEPSFLLSGLGMVVLPILLGTTLLILFMLKVIPAEYRLLVRLVSLYLPAALTTCFILYTSYKPLNSPTCKWMHEEEHILVRQVLDNWNLRKFRRLGFRWAFDTETESIELNIDANVESLPDEVSEVNRKSDRGLSK